MRNRLLPVLVILVISLVSVAALVYWASPKILNVSPGDNEKGVGAGSQIAITFSRRMREDMVMARLELTPSREGSYEWEETTLTFTPDQPWENSEQVNVKLHEGARAIGLLALPVWQPFEWTFYTGEPRLVYLYPADGPANIYIKNLTTGESEQLTNIPSGVLGYDIESGGNLLYYSRRNGQSNSSVYQIILNDKTGDKPVEIIQCVQATCSAISVSPQGNYLAYERTSTPGGEAPSYPQVWIMPLPKGDELIMQSSPTSEPYLAGEPLHQTIQPHWSPDGRLTFYDTNQAAFVVINPDGSEPLLIPNQTGQPGSWHPSGSSYVAAEITFIDGENLDNKLDIEQIGSSHLLQFNLENRSFQDMTEMDNLEDTTPVHSPDGSRLAFARKYLTVERWTPGRQLWVMSSDRRQAEQLTNEPFYNHFNMVWSPSSDLLAYVRFNQTQPIEPPQIWVIDLQNNLANQLIEGGYAPSWIP